jgi:hypothetical protein
MSSWHWNAAADEEKTTRRDDKARRADVKGKMKWLTMEASTDENVT